MKKYLIVLAALGAAALSSAQLVNGDFEQANADGSPIGWVSTAGVGGTVGSAGSFGTATNQPALSNGSGIYNYNINPENGNLFMLFNNAANPGPFANYDKISQTISDVAGQVYVLGFYIAEDTNVANISTNNGIYASWNASSSSTPSVYFTESYFSTGTDGNGNTSWDHFTVRLVGTGSDTLTFGALDTPGYIGLDNVTLTQAVPLPTFPVVLLGGIVVLLRRKK